MRYILKFWSWLAIGFAIIIAGMLWGVEARSDFQLWNIYHERVGESFIYWPYFSGMTSLLIAPLVLLVLGALWWIHRENLHMRKQPVSAITRYGLIAAVVIGCFCLIAYIFSGLGDGEELEEVSIVHENGKIYRILKVFFTFSDDAIAVYECDSWGLVCRLAASHKVKDGILSDSEITSTFTNSTLKVSLNATPVLTLPQG